MTISEMTIKQYRTLDGKVHDTYEAAFKHETEEVFYEWYNKDHELFGTYEDSIIMTDQMFKWIKDNEDFLFSFLSSRHYLEKL